MKKTPFILQLCFFYIVYTFFYGIVIKFTISNDFLFGIKTIVPELTLTVALLAIVIGKELRLSRKSVLFVYYLICIFLINICLHGITDSMLYLIRDIYLPCIFFVVIIGLNFDQKDIDIFLERLVRFCKFYLISGLILAIIEQFWGWEKTAEFYTGYSFYSVDPISKVKIAHNMGLLRAPGWTGNYASFGNYCLICYGIISNTQNQSFGRKNGKNVFWLLVALLCEILCTHKTGTVALGILVFFQAVYDFKNATTTKNKIIVAMFLVVLLTGVLIYLSSTDFYKGFLMRFSVWESIFSQVSLLEIIIPLNQFLYGSASENETLQAWDNTYMYLLFTCGIYGLICILRLIRETVSIQIKRYGRTYVAGLTILMLSMSLSTNLTQGRGFFSCYLILIGIGCNRFAKKKFNEIDETLSLNLVK